VKICYSYASLMDNCSSRDTLSQAKKFEFFA